MDMIAKVRIERRGKSPDGKQPGDLEVIEPGEEFSESDKGEQEFYTSHGFAITKKQAEAEEKAAAEGGGATVTQASKAKVTRK